MRPYDYTVEENKEIAEAHHQDWLAKLKEKLKKKLTTKELFPNTAESRAINREKISQLKKCQAERRDNPRERSDYERSIVKSYREDQERKKEQSRSSSASGRSIPQLGQ